jgi:hypothetical protein
VERKVNLTQVSNTRDKGGEYLELVLTIQLLPPPLDLFTGTTSNACAVHRAK